MLLSDRTILEEIRRKRIAIEPFKPECVQSSSVDLHLSNEFRVFKSVHTAFIDAREKGDYTERVEITGGEPFIMHPREFVLGCTVERIELPDDLFALLEGKSSLGRIGVIIHATAGQVHPGWKGRLTLELSNVGKLPVALYPGMEIAQIAFGQLSTPADKPYGHKELKSRYQGADGPDESRPARKGWKSI